ncbi:MAG: ribonuclease P protein subunit [Thermoplasmata archaeon]|nr:ribonuclease P protein subunit [Thermoplasmata archaeon]
MTDSSEPPRPPRRVEPPPEFAGELIGAPVRIERARGVAKLPITGTIVDETLRTLRVRPRGAERARILTKTGLEGTILLGGRELPLRGDLLRVRPEDRTKRLQMRGRRSLT